MSDINASPQNKKTWDNSASNYADHIANGSNLARSYSKAGITEDDIIYVASTMLYKIGIDIEDSDLRRGGTFDKELKVYHAKKDKWVNGTTSQKGFVKFHGDGKPFVYGLNWTTDEEIKQSIELEDVAEHLPSFSMDMINENGWLKPEHVPDGYANKPAPAIDWEAREQQRIANTARHEAEKVKLEESRQKAVVSAQTTLNESVDAYHKSGAPEKGQEPHANHYYLQQKYGEDLPHYAPYLKNLIASAHTYKGNPKTIYPLYQPGYDIMTGEMTALQRTMHDTEVVSVPGEKTKFIPKFKEDGVTPLITKKFPYGVNCNNSATPVHGIPSETIKNYYLAEGITTAATWAVAMDAANDPDAKNDCILSCYNASNMAKVATNLREKYTDANIFIIADNDYQTELNAGQKYANKAKEESGAIPISPPVEYLKDGQSDWDDIAKNMRDALDQVAQAQNPDVQARASFESVRDMLKKVIDVEYLKAINQANHEAEQLIQAAADKVEKNIESKASNNVLQDKAKSLLLAVQDPEFKNLTTSVLNTASFLEHSKNWTMPEALAGILNTVTLDDSTLKALEKNDRKQVLRGASSMLVELLTDNKELNSSGHNNLKHITELSKNGWDVNENYLSSFLNTMEANIQPGKQTAAQEEPEHLTEFAHSLVEFYTKQAQEKAVREAAALSVDTPTPQAPPPQPEPQAPMRRSP